MIPNSRNLYILLTRVGGYAHRPVSTILKDSKIYLNTIQLKIDSITSLIFLSFSLFNSDDFSNLIKLSQNDVASKLY